MEITVNLWPTAIGSAFVLVVSSHLLSSIHLHDGIKICDDFTMFGCLELILEPGGITILRLIFTRQLFDYELQLFDGESSASV